MHRGLIAAAAAALLAGCAITYPMVLPTVTAPPPLKLDPDIKLHTIGFANAVVTIRRGTVVVHLPTESSDKEFLGACNFRFGANAWLRWGKGKTTIAGKDDEFSLLFHDRMAAAGYRVIGDPRIVFLQERQDELAKAKYLIGARVIEIKGNICNLFSRWDGRSLNRGYGDMYMKIEWNVFLPFEKKTIARFRTEGLAHDDDIGQPGFADLFLSAFAEAADALATNPDFLRVVEIREEAEPASSVRGKFDAVRIEDVELSRRKISSIADLVADAVVTIRSAWGHGSGFVISDDGYILTNQHVVGDAAELTVIFRSRLKIKGRVIRRDPVRDVALIKLDVGGLKPLPIRTRPLGLTETVYAIGSPILEDLHSTITKGIVSAFRVEKGTKLSLIQADVDISGGNSGGPLVDANGNVVGISVAGFGVKKFSAGLNLFIPIRSAIEALNIEREKPG